jgi:hypothetical protein
VADPGKATDVQLPEPSALLRQRDEFDHAY